MHADSEASYGPTTRRRGKVKFVRATALTRTAEQCEREREDEHESGDAKQRRQGVGGKGKGKERAVEEEEEEKGAQGHRGIGGGRKRKGDEIRSFYESITRQSTRSSSSTPVPATHRSPTPDIDLTLSSSDSDSDSDSDDSIIFLDPTTLLPLPPPPAAPRSRARKRPFSSIHDLLPSFVPTASSSSTSTSTVPPPVLPPAPIPIQYGLKRSSIGWKLLSKLGWKEGMGLGADAGVSGVDSEKGIEGGGGLKVPLRAIERVPRSGLGVPGAEKKRVVSLGEAAQLREEERRKKEIRDQFGKGKRAMEKVVELERRERKEWIAYMNR